MSDINTRSRSCTAGSELHTFDLELYDPEVINPETPGIGAIIRFGRPLPRHSTFDMVAGAFRITKLIEERIEKMVSEKPLLSRKIPGKPRETIELPLETAKRLQEKLPEFMQVLLLERAGENGSELYQAVLKDAA